MNFAYKSQLNFTFSHFFSCKKPFVCSCYCHGRGCCFVLLPVACATAMTVAENKNICACAETSLCSALT